MKTPLRTMLEEAGQEYRQGRTAQGKDRIDLLSAIALTDIAEALEDFKTSVKTITAALSEIADISIVTSNSLAESAEALAAMRRMREAASTLAQRQARKPQSKKEEPS